MCTFLVTFEDKRKENFDKGQAELERRRALLQEQLKQEENARLEKERREAEKRERIRFVLIFFFLVQQISLAKFCKRLTTVKSFIIITYCFP